MQSAGPIPVSSLFRGWRPAAVFAVTLLLSAPARSNDTIFTSADDAKWSNPANWTDGIPTAESSFFIGGTAPLFALPVSAYIDNEAVEANIGWIGFNTDEPGRLYIWNNSSLSMTNPSGGGMIVGLFAPGEVFLAGNSSLTLANGITVGHSDYGEVRVEDPGTILRARLASVAVYEQGILAVDSGGRIEISGSIELGNSNSSDARIEINGTEGSRGTLSASRFLFDDGTKRVVFNGGVFEANASWAEVFVGADPGDVVFESGGARIDTDGFNIGTARNLSGTGGLTKLGEGTLTLSGANTYEGGTVVSAGTLALNGTTGSQTGTGDVLIEDGARLTGNGTIAGSVVSAGILAPGNSPGLIVIEGNLTLESSSILEIEIASLSDFDRLSVSGHLEYGGTLSIIFIDGFVPGGGDLFPVFDDFTSWSGAFDTVLFNEPGWTGLFDHNTGTLTLTAIPEPSTWALLAAAGAALAACRWRRRRFRRS